MYSVNIDGQLFETPMLSVILYSLCAHLETVSLIWITITNLLCWVFVVWIKKYLRPWSLYPALK